MNIFQCWKKISTLSNKEYAQGLRNNSAKPKTDIQIEIKIARQQVIMILLWVDVGCSGMSEEKDFCD